MLFAFSVEGAVITGDRFTGGIGVIQFLLLLIVSMG